MIRIEKKFGDGFVEPATPLTEEQQARVIGRWGDDTHFLYFEKGDEETPEYAAFLQHNVIPGGPPPGAALTAFMQASEEDKMKMAAELKKYLKP